MRILWCSDHPAATSGYSVQTALTAPRLQRAGIADVALLASYGQHGHISEYAGLRVYPGGHDSFGQDVIPDAAKDWRADIVITLKDSFVYKPETFRGFRWCPLTPVDHDPAPPAVVAALRGAYSPIAYAPNGVRSLRREGFDPLYAPHGFDSNQFWPMDKGEARRTLGLPEDAFIVGTVAVNRGGLPSRKAWDELLAGVGMFRKDNPGVKTLYLTHTHPADDGHEGGIPLRQVANDHGVADITLFPHVSNYRLGVSPDHLRLVYNAMDVLLAVSLGEGFGIPTLEAQACGVPVIAGRWAAQTDLVWSGWFVETDEAHRYRTTQMSYVYMPDPEAIADRIQQAYAARESTVLRDQAIQGAAPYQIDRVVAEHWRPLLERLEQRIARERSVPRGVVRIVTPREVLA